MRIKMKSEKLITIEKQIEKLVIQRHKESLKCIKKSFKQLFADYPDLQSFGWSQYTPYWNDGSPCEFMVYNDEPMINGDCVSVWSLEQHLRNVKNRKNYELAIEELQIRIKECKDNKWHSDETLLDELAYLKKLYASEEDQKQLKYELDRLLAIKKVLDSISEESYMSIFGDHVEVLVTKDGWKTESVDHD
jgi:RecG-like helicase